MKKDKKTYVLIGLVVFIWGILGVKVIGTLSAEEKPLNNIAAPKIPMTVTTKKRDTFSIVALYRDPFLGTFPKTQTGQPSQRR